MAVIGWFAVCSKYNFGLPILHWKVSPINGLKGFTFVVVKCKNDIKWTVTHFNLSKTSGEWAALVK